MLVTVDTTKPYRLTVNKHLTIPDLHTAESHLAAGPLYYISEAINELKLQRVEKRGLGCPQFRAGNPTGNPTQFSWATLRIPLIHH